jgi:hypothetical protein
METALLKRENSGVQSIQQWNGNQLIKNEDGCYSLSAYTGELTEIGIKESGEKMRVAFPKIFGDKTKAEKAQYMAMFIDRLKDNGFTDERFRDAVNYVIDNYKAWNREPCIGDFISFDKDIKCWDYETLLFKYREAYFEGAKFDPIASYYKRADIGVDHAVYVKKEDFLKYKLKPWQDIKEVQLEIKADEKFLPPEWFSGISSILFNEAIDDAEAEKQISEINKKFGVKDNGES